MDCNTLTNSSKPFCADIKRSSENQYPGFSDDLFYSGLNLNQDKATKPQTVQIVRQGEATPYWFKFNPL
ncbi:hypothetical protein [Neisseria sicca]|uniref:hypothetical protein n=1 Tax=Neisseria sicca TaxID=490 RepID=UPI0034D957CF